MKYINVLHLTDFSFLELNNRAGSYVKYRVIERSMLICYKNMLLSLEIKQVNKTYLGIIMHCSCLLISLFNVKIAT